MGFITPEFPLRKHRSSKGLKDSIFVVFIFPGREKFGSRHTNMVFFSTKIANFSLSHLIPIAFWIHCIFEDKNGYFWISTNKGLFRIAKKDLLLSTIVRNFKPYYYYYAKEQGFKTNEFNGGCQPCAVRLDNGLVSFPSLIGIVMFTPENVKMEIPDKDIFIDEVKVGDSASTFSGDSIYLPFDPKAIQIRVSTPYFGDAYNLHMSYALKKNASDQIVWQTLDNSGIIQISSLISGNYELIIKKQIETGVKNYTQRTISVFVKKAWFETLWFKFAMAVVGLALIYIYLRFRTKYLERKTLQLEQIVLTRTQNLQAALQMVKKSNFELNGQIKKQSVIVASITHDVRTPLNFIIKISDNIRNAINAEHYDKIEPMIKSAQETSTQMKQLLDNLVGYIKINSFQSVGQKENINLHSLVEEQFTLYNQAYKKYPNTFINDISKEITIHAGRQKLEIIIRNLIDNANKYTYKGIIHVYTEESTGCLYLFISDSGSGMPEALASWLNHRPDQPTEEVPAEMKGLGLLIVKEICGIAGIAVQVHCDNGTHIRLCLVNRDE